MVVVVVIVVVFVQKRLSPKKSRPKNLGSKHLGNILFLVQKTLGSKRYKKIEYKKLLAQKKLDEVIDRNRLLTETSLSLSIICY